MNAIKEYIALTLKAVKIMHPLSTEIRIEPSAIYPNVQITQQQGSHANHVIMRSCTSSRANHAADLSTVSHPRIGGRRSPAKQNQISAN